MFAQTPEEKTVQFDTEFIEQKKFDNKKIESYKKQDAFIYVVEKREPTILEKAWNWFKRTIKKVLSYLFDDISPAVGFLKWILNVLPYAIAGLVLFLIIKFFLKVNARNIIDGKKAQSIVNLSDEESLIKEKDLLALIKTAITSGNFKLATRYYYLLLLKTLSEKELISWQQEKTNEDYIKELATNKSLYKEFETLTHLYDYVWYGEFLIDKEKFLKAETNFKKVIAKI
ncbi:DUF4129 domain-containing protein [Tenacibaculum sp. AHE15PA]|uniref:DUF4129 domain-containing protein n=1 Tax=unclassified Tenacibaculum TaxID=2635139 RepID=UPI001C4FA932|nr:MULTISPECIES: DUF4129 domain-containing protein [unclassified Tenacibaculum]QXP73985.1 DUF4129 domain-containing protein [Tenacibaculum sp. AHE14PA]QXP75647.1 DUF4129 domain-containing protein [Tenacibaculum sp. AHE15PA]